jgi:hypothetical protein
MAGKVKVKKGPKVKSTGNGGTITESKLFLFRDSVDSFALKAEAAVEKLDESIQCPQALLRALIVAEAVEKAAKKLVSNLQTKFLAHADAQGAFEPGKIAVQITETSRRSVSWKDEAVRLGEELADEKGDEWDKKEFEKDISSKYPKSTSRKVSLVESL